MKEKDIRDVGALNEYLRLVEEDTKKIFDFTKFKSVNCPGCKSQDFSEEFNKFGFIYVLCKDCRTLFVNPRPSFKELKEFYTNSESATFWVNEFFMPMADKRKTEIYRPQAEHVATSVLDKDKKDVVIGDIGSGFGLFLEELRELLPDNRYVAIEPSKEMADICRGKNLEVKESCLEDLNETKENFDMLSSFSLLEHLYEPDSFLKKANSLLRPGGLLLFTTLNYHGFDILLLGERSKSVTPPHHLNFFNTSSVKTLMERAGFEILEITTPGRLDWDIVEGMIKKEGVDIGRPWSMLADEASETLKTDLQNWISENNLSSHMRVLAKKV